MHLGCLDGASRTVFGHDPIHSMHLANEFDLTARVKDYNCSTMCQTCFARGNLPMIILLGSLVSVLLSTMIFQFFLLDAAWEGPGRSALQSATLKVIIARTGQIPNCGGRKDETDNSSGGQAMPPFFLRVADRAIKHCRSSRTRG